jgi:hypothetical protein
MHFSKRVLPSSSWKTDHQIIFSASVYVSSSQIAICENPHPHQNTHFLSETSMLLFPPYRADFTATHHSSSWDYMRAPCEYFTVGCHRTLLHRVASYCSEYSLFCWGVALYSDFIMKYERCPISSILWTRAHQSELGHSLTAKFCHLFVQGCKKFSKKLGATSKV